MVVSRIDDQVYICFNGPDGQVMQTSRSTYERYYRLLGWKLLGPAAPLPLYDDWGE